MRVVSLLPSATEVLVASSVHTEDPLLVGRSHECDFPEYVIQHPILTAAINEFESSAQIHDATVMSLRRGEGLYCVDEPLLKELAPDVILTQDLCAVCSVDVKLVERISQDMPTKPNIVCLNPFTLEDMLDDIIRVGKAVGRKQSAKLAVQALQKRIAAATAVASAAAAQRHTPLKCCVLEWVDPIFPGGHWTPQLVELAGGEHPINPPRGKGKGAKPSFAVSNQALVDADCDWIVLCPCGLDLETIAREALTITTQPWWQGLRAVKEGRVVAVDGSAMFNRPGPRLVEALEFLTGLLNKHHDLIPATFPWVWLADLLDKAPAAKTGSPALEGPANGVANGVSEGNEERQSAKFSPEIEEAHQAAMSSGRATYTDPETGYSVFTEKFYREQQGWCCGNRCRHCPFGHFKVEGIQAKHTQQISVPTHLRPGKARLKRDCSLLLWLGNIESHVALRCLEEAACQLEPGYNSLDPVLVVATQLGCEAVWGQEGVHLRQVMDHFRRLYRHAVVVPFEHPPQPTNPDDVAQAVQQAAALFDEGQVKEVVVPFTEAAEGFGAMLAGLPLSMPLVELPEGELGRRWKEDLREGHVTAAVIGNTGEVPGKLPYKAGVLTIVAYSSIPDIGP